MARDMGKRNLHRRSGSSYRGRNSREENRKSDTILVQTIICGIVFCMVLFVRIIDTNFTKTIQAKIDTVINSEMDLENINSIEDLKLLSLDSLLGNNVETASGNNDGESGEIIIESNTEEVPATTENLNSSINDNIDRDISDTRIDEDILKQMNSEKK